MSDSIPDDLHTNLVNLFTDPRWRKLLSSRHLYCGTVDDQTVGVCLATYNANFDNYAINKAAFSMPRTKAR
jgi:hypothetical protein